ncbi:MAG: type II toxin-antitoxin system VapC family toxin [Candidatus Aminicenantes bacterium]|nr:type II toxin-antitoxin system VapC family toxin [Candidatus Aminicenantes bacterium]
MNYIVDTSIIISVITNEKHKKKLVKLTQGADLTAPSSLHWEMGNAFSAMMKRKRITLAQAIAAVEAYRDIPLRFSDIELDTALELSAKLNVYAYDAYVIGCALKHKYPILTLDKGLMRAARKAGAAITEVKL